MQVMTQQHPPANSVMVLCCMCGVPMTPNAANTCATCLASTADITRGIATEATLHQCRGCQRWHKDAGAWVSCELESRELMSLCLSHVSGLQKSKSASERVRLVDASWIWTEPHSMRLKVRLTVQRQVSSGPILQQSFTTVFIVRNQQCVECQAEFRQGSWKSLVQVRQRVSHKRTFLYLEQLILKHGAHRGCLSIETFKDGMDFYFPDKSKASRFLSFLETVCPVQTKNSKKLIGTDDKSNISNFKYTHLVEICPLCKDDLVYLPKKTARQLGNISRLVLVKNISNLIHFVDPLTGQQASLNNDAYWRDPIRPLVTAARSRLVRYVVLGKEAVFLRQNVSKRKTNRKMKSRLARLTLAAEDDLGVNDQQQDEQSHVGYLLQSGDVCVGYNLLDTQFVDDDAEASRAAGQLPAVVVVRKLYGQSSENHHKKRIWQLQRLDVDVAEANPNARGAKSAAANDEMDTEDFLQEVEADKDMRANMNLYKSDFMVKKQQKQQQQQHLLNGGDGSDNDDGDENNEDDDQQIRLDELLDGLALDAGPDKMDTTTQARGTGDDDDEDGGFGMRVEGEKASQDGIRYFTQEEARNIRDKDSAKTVSGLSKAYEGF